MARTRFPEFHPTVEEFNGGFVNYIKKIQAQCWECGFAKIVAPESWNAVAEKQDEEFDRSVESLFVSSPICQHAIGEDGYYQLQNVVKKGMRASKFCERAKQQEPPKSASDSLNEIENEFWDQIINESPLYGSDTSGTLFPAELFHWNLSRLTEQNMLKFLGTNVQGITSSHLYFGMWGSMFAWHTEDMDLFSINYLHYGKPKYWYGVPEKDRHLLEKLAAELFPREAKACRQFLRHKTTMIHPSILRKAGITVYSDIQREREFIVTLPGAYHAGFNAGLNCAEAVNFAVESWIPRGQIASVCYCKKDSIIINMDIFLHNYRLAIHFAQQHLQAKKMSNNNLELKTDQSLLQKRKNSETVEDEDTVLPVPGTKRLCSSPPLDT